MHRSRPLLTRVALPLLLVPVVTASLGATTACSRGREVVDRFEGDVSFYAESLDGGATASGEPFSNEELTAAHRDLPFGTRLRLTVPDTGASVVVRVNDRGPHADDRVLDLSRAAARELGIVDAGVGHVQVEVLASARPARAARE